MKRNRPMKWRGAKRGGTYGGDWRTAGIDALLPMKNFNPSTHVYSVVTHSTAERESSREEDAEISIYSIICGMYN